jgi:predicted secreted protein
MPKKSLHFAVFSLLACSFVSLATVRGLAQEQVQTDAEIVQEISHDTSPQ